MKAAKIGYFLICAFFLLQKLVGWKGKDLKINVIFAIKLLPVGILGGVSTRRSRIDNDYFFASKLLKRKPVSIIFIKSKAVKSITRSCLTWPVLGCRMKK